ncbi:MAG: NlpC/P60 family protein [Bacteroidales bacterium]|nr:NlpC/P60 family protein [Bacteroidales bacterium]
MKKDIKFIVLLCVLLFGANTLIAQVNVNDLLKDIKKQFAPDSRIAICDLEATLSSDKWIIKGKVDNNNLKQNILQNLSQNNIQYIDSISVLEYTQKKPWAVVKLALASHRTAGKHAAEMATQTIMGTPVKILEYSGDWARVQGPDEYISYVPSNSLHKMTQIEFDNWRKSTRYIVTEYQTRLVEKPNSDKTVTDLVMGNILQYVSRDKDFIKLTTPDGREGYVHKSEVKELSKWVDQSFDAKKITKVAHRLMGHGYLWGGTTTKVTDCSGLVKVSYFANGIILHRDASQQALIGKRIEAKDWKDAKLGDLLFWGTKSGRVTHVGIYLKDGEYIHCSGRVKINSVDPNADNYLTTPFLSISRIEGEIGTRGITMVRDHKWYF